MLVVNIMYYHQSIICQKSMGKKDDKKKRRREERQKINVPQTTLLLSFCKMVLNGSEVIKYIYIADRCSDFVRKSLSLVLKLGLRSSVIFLVPLNIDFRIESVFN